jgi:putative ATP-dependent endonuclease of OLD family
MLFARVVVFFEGETEEQAVPDFAEKYWGKHPNDSGYSFIAVQGHGNYLPFLRMAESFKIPWLIFSDGETAAVASVNAALAAVGQDQIPNNPRVVVLPDGKDFEAYLVNNASREALIAAVIEHEAKSPQHTQALQTKWAAKSAAEQLTALMETIDENKTQYGSRVGKILPVPAALEDLFKNIETELAPPKRPAQKV